MPGLLIFSKAYQSSVGQLEHIQQATHQKDLERYRTLAGVYSSRAPKNAGLSHPPVQDSMCKSLKGSMRCLSAVLTCTDS